MIRNKGKMGGKERERLEGSERKLKERKCIICYI